VKNGKKQLSVCVRVYVCVCVTIDTLSENVQKYTYYLVIQINCNLSLVLERFHLFWDSWNKDLNSSRATLVMLEYALLSPSSMSSSPVSTVDHVIGIFNTEVKHWFIFWVGAFIDKFLENTKINYFSDEQIC